MPSLSVCTCIHVEWMVTAISDGFNSIKWQERPICKYIHSLFVRTDMEKHCRVSHSLCKQKYLFLVRRYIDCISIYFVFSEIKNDQD